MSENKKYNIICDIYHKKYNSDKHNNDLEHMKQNDIYGSLKYD